MELFPWGFLVVGPALGALLVWFLVLAHRKEKERQARFDAEALRLGLAIRRGARDLVPLYRPLKAYPHSPDGHRVNESFQGRWRGLDVTLVNCTGVSRSRDSKGNTRTSYHPAGIAMVRFPARFPRTTIVRETWAHKVADAFGAEDIDFESDEFNRRYWVKSDDRRFAYNLVHPRLMAFLMEEGAGSWEVRGELVVTWRPSHVQPEEIEPTLKRVAAFVDLMPSSLRAAPAVPA